MYRHFLKRTIDIILSFLAIIILAIPMLVIAIIVDENHAIVAWFKKRFTDEKNPPIVIK